MRRHKAADHLPAAQVIAANFTRRRSRKGGLAATNSQWNAAQSVSPQHILHTPRHLPGRPPRATTPLQAASKLGRKRIRDHSEQGIGREEKVPSKFFKRSSVKRPLRPKTSSPIFTKLQPKRIEPEREIKKRHYRKRKRRADKPDQNDMSRIKNRVKYLLTRMNLEQNLIDAYSQEGWKGQSREKLRPERELQKAKAKIVRFQLRIRDAMEELDSLSLEGTMKELILDSHGQIYHEDIFCAICKRQDVVVNDDIILCDGACDRAFHQLCLRPPLRTIDIPPEDEGWLCPVCDCKLECLDAVNAYFGTSYDIDDHWKNIFAEAAAFTSDGGKLPAAIEEWPSEDSEDDDYIPGQNNNHQAIDVKSIDGSSDESASVTSSDQRVTESYSSDDVLNELADIMENGFEVRDGKDVMEELAAMDEDNVVLVDGKRQRKEVDYKHLHDEMFGRHIAADEVSEDEDWGPRKQFKKSKQSLQASHGDLKEKHLKNPSAGGTQISVFTKSSPTLQNKQSRVSLTPHALEKLRAAFKENPLPSRACKEGLSKQLGLSFWKVHVWFKNVRCAALKKGLIEPAKRRVKNRSGITTAMKKAQSSRLHKDALRSKAEKKEEIEHWLAAMDKLSEAELKLGRLKSLLWQNQSEPHDCGTVMYVAVANVIERTPT